MRDIFTLVKRQRKSQMKLQPITNTPKNINTQSDCKTGCNPHARNSLAMKNNNIRPVAFRGLGTKVGDSIIKIMDAIAAGGLAASFMSQDFFGLCLPRTIAGLFVGRDGEKYNWKNALEEALREFITGPSMFLIPIGCLGLMTKYIGGASTIAVNSIRELGDVFSLTVSNLRSNKHITETGDLNISDKEVKRNFYENVFEQIRRNNGFPEEINGKKFSEVYAQRAIELDDYSLKGRRLKWFIDKQVRQDNKTYKQKLSQIVRDIAEINKGVINPSDNPLKVRISNEFVVNGLKPLEKNPGLEIEKIIKRIDVYANDAITSLRKYLQKAKTAENLRDITERFNTSRIGARVLANVAITAFVAGFSVIIPKLYMVNKTNPKTEALKQNLGGANV